MSMSNGFKTIYRVYINILVKSNISKLIRKIKKIRGNFNTV